ncbi:MAG: hypothetical protein ACK5JT_12970 [Hyphomicrobiaceae bacterium]
MTRLRLVLVLALIAMIVVLLFWQRQREALMAECLSQGRFWNGPETRCESPPYAPIIKRALERS